MMDPTSLTYWFPKLEAAGIPVPKTILIEMPREAMESVWANFDGKDGTAEQDAALNAFYARLTEACQSVGLPAFLRTSHTSGKHGWKDTCFVQSGEAIPRHVMAIIEYCELASFMGLPYDTWAVREFLPTLPLGTCPHYGDMPVCREFRFFVDGGIVRCHHAYWPLSALEQGGWFDGRAAEVRSAAYESLCRIDEQDHELWSLAEAAGRAVGGSWSVDILETRRGWIVTDMAEASKSFHWEGCPHAQGNP